MYNINSLWLKAAIFILIFQPNGSYLQDSVSDYQLFIQKKNLVPAVLYT